MDTFWKDKARISEKQRFITTSSITQIVAFVNKNMTKVVVVAGGGVEPLSPIAGATTGPK